MPGERRPPRPATGWMAAVIAVALSTAGQAVARAPDPAPAAASQHQQVIRIGYLTRAEEETRPAVSGLPPRLSDAGVQGARLGLDDDNTTGRFTGQRFELTETVLAEGADAAAAVRALVDDGIAFIVADLDATDLDRALTAVEAVRALIFNARVPDDRFRNADCRPFLLHTVASRAMLADALAQYLVRKRWTRWFLVTGKRAGDALYAEAIRRSARRFGGEIVVEKPWIGTFDARRTAAEEVPLFTQGADYDVLIVADEGGIFGHLFLYRTWQPRPIAGTQGLSPDVWHPRLEQWGAAQLQSRFYRKAGRPMTGRDYAAWVALRSIGEAATRTRSAERDTIARYLRGDAFELAAFKGRKLSYREWDGQLRQPIPLSWTESVVSVSPQEGFLHAWSELDTLGDDAPESGCRVEGR